MKNQILLSTRHRLRSLRTGRNWEWKVGKRIPEQNQKEHFQTSTKCYHSNTKTVKTQRKENHRPISLRNMHVKSSVKFLQIEYGQTTKRPSTKTKLASSLWCKNGSTYVNACNKSCSNQIHGLQRQNHMIIPIDAERTSDKIHHDFTLKNAALEGRYLRWQRLLTVKPQPTLSSTENTQSNAISTMIETGYALSWLLTTEGLKR